MQSHLVVKSWIGWKSCNDFQSSDHRHCIKRSPSFNLYFDHHVLATRLRSLLVALDLFGFVLLPLLISICLRRKSSKLPSRKLQLEHLINLGIRSILHFRNVKPHYDDRDDTKASKEKSRLHTPIALVDIKHVRHEEVEGPRENSRNNKSQALRLATKAD